MAAVSETGRNTLKKRWLFCVVLCVFLGACAVNPVTGKKEFSLISEQQEIALGQQTDQEIRGEYGVYADPALEAYIASVGQALVPHTHRPKLGYHFAVLDTPVINAFAVPGGYVYVTRGILALMNTEAELAAVIGHELGHVNARHSVRRMSNLMIAQIGLAVGSALSDSVARISGFASVGIQLLFLKFSRDDEREADDLGVRYARGGGYNPGDMIAFFNSLEKMGDLSGKSALPGFLSTHPLTGERIEKVKSLLAADDSRLARKNEAYLRKVENMVYGEDPRQGFIEGNAFHHPELRFSFDFPAGWKAQNTPAQVMMASQDGNAAVVLQAEKSAKSLENYANKVAEKIEGRQFLNDQRESIHGFTAYHQVYQVTQQNREPLKARLSFVRKGQFIFTFTALSTAGGFNGFEGSFRSIVGSFRELTNPAVLGRQPQRLRLVRSGGAESLQNIFRREGVQKDSWTKLAILNDLDVAAVPAKNGLIKIVK